MRCYCFKQHCRVYCYPSGKYVLSYITVILCVYTVLFNGCSPDSWTKRLVRMANRFVELNSGKSIYRFVYADDAGDDWPLL